MTNRLPTIGSLSLFLNGVTRPWTWKREGGCGYRSLNTGNSQGEEFISTDKRQDLCFLFYSIKFLISSLFATFFFFSQNDRVIRLTSASTMKRRARPYIKKSYLFKKKKGWSGPAVTIGNWSFGGLVGGKYNRCRLEEQVELHSFFFQTLFLRTFGILCVSFSNQNSYFYNEGVALILTTFQSG